MYQFVRYCMGRALGLSGGPGGALGGAGRALRGPGVGAEGTGRALRDPEVGT